MRRRSRRRARRGGAGDLGRCRHRGSWLSTEHPSFTSIRVRYNVQPMTNASEIIEAAMALPPEARAQIAEQLLASLDPAQAEVDAAWEAEIDRRVREVEEGRVTLLPHEQ